MRQIRIALAADTILYAPVYFAAERRLVPGLELVVLPTAGELGDREAFKRLASDADVCIADPMVIVPQGPDDSLGAAVVGALITKIGLWGISTCFTKSGITRSDSPLTHGVSDNERKLERILAYSGASTAGRLLGKIQDQPGYRFVVPSVDFGTELEYVSQKFDGGRVDMVITSDLVGALAVERERKEIAEHARRRYPEDADGIVLPELVTDFGDGKGARSLFTAIIASRQLHQRRRGDLVLFLQGVKEAVQELYTLPKTELVRLAKELWSVEGTVPSLNSRVFGRELPVERQYDFVLDGLRHLRDQRVWSETLRVDSDEWASSHQIWHRSDVVEARAAFVEYVKEGPVEEINPSEMRLAMQSWAKKLRGLAISFFASYAVLAGLAGLAGRPLATMRDVCIFTSLVLSTGSLLWWIRGQLGIDEQR